MVKDKESSTVVSASKKNFSFKRVSLISVAVIVLIVLLGSSIYFYTQYQKSQMLLSNPNKAGKDEINALLVKVGKHYALPVGDEPTLATVSDIAKLKGQIFFANAQNGDKVLIYPKTGLAIIYRPEIDKIINVGPVNTEAGADQTTPSEVTTGVKLAIYNGTATTGLTTRAGDALMALSSLKTEVLQKNNASSMYAESVVVDLTGKNAQAATQLAVFAKGKVSSLPAGEIKPEGVDLLIILGDSYIGITPTPTLIPTP